LRLFRRINRLSCTVLGLRSRAGMVLMKCWTSDERKLNPRSERGIVGSASEGGPKMSAHAYAVLFGIGVPKCLLFSGSAVLFFSEKTLWSLLQLFGSRSLIVVVLTHIAEAFHLLPGLGWRVEHSVGHHLDFGSAVLGLTSFRVTFCFYVLSKRVA
jgi:hypothetical protein